MVVGLGSYRGRMSKRRRGYDDGLLRRGAHLAPRIDEPVPFCWMCDRTDGARAKEHTFARSLLERIGAADEMFSPTHYDMLGRVLTSRAMPAKSLIAGEICKTCNGGWMSSLEAAALPLLVPDDPATEINEADQEILARWFLKTAAVLNSSQNYRLMLPAAVRHSASGRPHPDVKVFVAIVIQKDGSLNFAQRGGISVAMGSSAQEALPFVERGYACAIAVQSLLGSVAYAPPGGWAQPIPGMRQIWPSGSPFLRADLPLVEDFTDALFLGGVSPRVVGFERGS